MPQTVRIAERDAEPKGERRRVEAVVETLATLNGRGESVAEVAHDARNMVTALGLYCDLLEEPGVLAAPFAHYGNELRLVAAASRRLVEKLVDLDAHMPVQPDTPVQWRLENDQRVTTAVHARQGQAIDGNLNQGTEKSASLSRRWDRLPAVPVANLAAELLANRNLLSAMAGPLIALTVEAAGGARPVRLTGEDLTRILVNLVKNSAEAMPRGGRIHMGLFERRAEQGAAACLMLTIEDNGPGIPDTELESVFNSGYTTRTSGDSGNGGWPLHHRGLGLAITRSIVEAAGGRVCAGKSEQGGARFEIELPVRKASF